MLHRGESKCSIQVRHRTQSDGPSPKSPQFISHFKSSSCLKADERRPDETETRHKVLVMTFSLNTKIYHTGRTIILNITTGVQKSLAHQQDFKPSSTLLLQAYKTPVKYFTKFLWHATRIRAFFAKKKWHVVTSIVVP